MTLKALLRWLFRIDPPLFQSIRHFEQQQDRRGIDGVSWTFPIVKD
jgi:hypothetical protein